MWSIGVVDLLVLCLFLLAVPTQSWQLFSRKNVNWRGTGDYKRGSVFASSTAPGDGQKQSQGNLVKPAAALGLSLLLGVAPVPLFTAPSDLIAATGITHRTATTTSRGNRFGHTGRSLLLPEAKAAALPVAGTPAPDFSLPSNQGKDLSLADFAGKRTVLYFYPVRHTNTAIDSFNAELIQLNHRSFYCYNSSTNFRSSLVENGSLSTTYVSLASYYDN